MKQMMIYNTLSRKKEVFEPVHEGKVGIYACGPTVYNYFHIGNARPFIIFDTLRRFLEHLGYDVTFVQNFTDIDDKMIKRANEEGTTVEAIAEKYISEYFKDAEAIGVKKADVHPRATRHIGEIIGLIKKLENKGLAYRVENGDVYFDTQAWRSNYGRLIGQDLDDLESGARVDVGDLKRHPMDFALWKAKKPGEPFWKSPWSEGRPGWHIECSAMSMKYLGETFDIHCGGVDLIFPHHENEIAQSVRGRHRQALRQVLDAQRPHQRGQQEDVEVRGQLLHRAGHLQGVRPGGGAHVHAVRPLSQPHQLLPGSDGAGQGRPGAPVHRPE